MPPVKASPDRFFVISTSAEKTDAETRKRIRSHVMRGKTRGKNQHGEPRHLKSMVPLKNCYDRPVPDKQDQNRLVIPRKVGSDLTFTPLPNSVEPQRAVDVMKFGTIIVRARYVLEPCLIFLKGSGKDVIEELFGDALSFQSVILMAEAHFDLWGGRSSDYMSHMHLKTLHLLRERLSLVDETSRVANATIFAVAGLALHARIFGEDDSAKHHLEGIRKIVDLRGGIKNFTQPTKLVTELLRCDIGMALHTGAKPVFFHSDQHSDIFPYPDMMGFQYNTEKVVDDLDDNLAQAWRVMQSFCSMINLTVKAQGRITWELFMDTMASLMYRLLSMSFEHGSQDEAIRLGLLALSSHVFLQGKLFMVSYVHMSAAYRDCLRHLGRSTRVASHNFCWLLIVGAVSVFKSQDEIWIAPLLRKNVESCGVTSWDEMRVILDSLMWLPLVQEKPGKAIFDYALAKNKGM